MKQIARVVILLCCLLIVGLAAMLWNATGRAGYTKYFDAERAQRMAEADAEESLGDVFEEAGTGVAPPEPLKNRFELGMLPGSPNPIDKHFVSLATIAGPAAVAAVVTLGLMLLDPKKRRRR